MAKPEKVELDGVPPKTLDLVKGLLGIFDVHALRALAHFLCEQGIIEERERDRFIALVVIVGDEKQ